MPAMKVGTSAVGSSSTVGGADDVGKSLDLRWAVRVTVGDSLDLRWPVRVTVGDSLDLRWGVETVALFASKDVDLRWAVKANASDDLSLRWAVRSNVADSLDLRWSVRSNVADDLDLRWALRELRFVFEPPVVLADPPVLPDTRLRDPSAYRLLRFYDRRPVGRNIYLLNDNTLTTRQPRDMTTVARIFYGGHIETVTTAERLLLVAAGYSVTTEDV